MVQCYLMSSVHPSDVETRQQWERLNNLLLIVQRMQLWDLQQKKLIRVTQKIRRWKMIGPLWVCLIGVQNILGWEDGEVSRSFIRLHMREQDWHTDVQCSLLIKAERWMSLVWQICLWQVSESSCLLDPVPAQPFKLVPGLTHNNQKS